MELTSPPSLLCSSCSIRSIMQPCLIPLTLCLFLESLSEDFMALTLLARTGRLRQRYDGHLRLVAGCIPYRLKQNVENYSGDLISSLEVLMISSPNRHDLVFPKGGWEDDETVHEAACREALEEAGVRGDINETELGNWEFRSKSNQNSCSLEGACKGYMFALKVTEVLDCWPEQASHQRRWVTLKEAFKLCRYEWMREALREFKIRVMRGQLKLPVSELSEPTSFCLMKPTASEPAIDTIGCFSSFAWIKS